jgi:hypothetical protein
LKSNEQMLNIKCAVCPRPAAKGSILCEPCQKAAQKQAKKLDKAYLDLMSLDLLKTHYD